MKISSPDDVPSTGLNLRLSTEAMPDADAQTPHSFTAERQTRRQAEQAHAEKLRQRGARIRAANEAVRAYLRESGTRDYPRAFGYIQRTRPELFAQMQVPAGLPVVENPRCARMLAVNDAVSDYMRESGTRDYSAAFNHIVRTRSDLFAGMQDSSGLLAAANFNPYHDQTGRFTTSDGVGGQAQNKLIAFTSPEDAPAQGDTHLPSFGVHDANRHHASHGLLGQHKGAESTGQPKTHARSVDSIASHAYNSANFATCVATSIQTLIATMKKTNPLPDAVIRQEIEEEVNSLLDKYRKEGKKTKLSLDWNDGLKASGPDYAAIVQAVLKRNGVESSYHPGYGSAEEMADAIAGTDKPVMIDIAVDAKKDAAAGARKGAATGAEELEYAHSVSVQWDAKANDGKGQFLMNNVLSRGETKRYAREQFVSGKMSATFPPKTGSNFATSKNFAPLYNYAAIFAEQP